MKPKKPITRLSTLNAFLFPPLSVAIVVVFFATGGGTFEDMLVPIFASIYSIVSIFWEVRVRRAIKRLKNEGLCFEAQVVDIKAKRSFRDQTGHVICEYADNNGEHHKVESRKLLLDLKSKETTIDFESKVYVDINDSSRHEVEVFRKK